MSGQLSFLREKFAQRGQGVMTRENVASALGEIVRKIELILQKAKTRKEVCLGRTWGVRGKRGFQQYQGLQQIIEEVEALWQKLKKLQYRMQNIERDIAEMHNSLVFMSTIVMGDPTPNPYNASPEMITDFIFGKINRITGKRFDGLLGHATIELLRRNRSSRENRTHSTKDNQGLSFAELDMFAELEGAFFRDYEKEESGFESSDVQGRNSPSPSEFSQGGYEVRDDGEEMIESANQPEDPPEFYVSDDEGDEFPERHSRSSGEFPGRGWE